MINFFVGYFFGALSVSVVFLVLLMARGERRKHEDGLD